MSRRTTAIRLAAQAIENLTGTDEGSLPAARATVDRLSFEIAKLEVLERPVVLAELDLASLDRALEVEHISAPMARVVAKLKAGEG